MKNKRYSIAGLFIANIMLLIYTRGIGISYKLTSLVETDPVRYVYQARKILEYGRMPEVDILRSSPLGEKTGRQLTFYPYIIAGIYRIIKFTGIDFGKFVVALPIIFLVLTVSVIYMLIWRVFGHKVAFLSVNILTVTPPFLVRTYAGFADRDGLVLLLSMLTFLFYIQSYFCINWKQLVFRFISSLFTLCLGLTWHGVGLFVSVVITLELIRIIIDRYYNKLTLGLLVLWALPVILGLLSLKPGVYRHLDQPYAFMVVLYPAFVLIVASLLLMVKQFPFLEKIFSINYYMPTGFSVTFLFGLACMPLAFDRISNALIPSLIDPFGKDTVLQMIGELQKLGIEGWSFYPGAFLISMTAGIFTISGDVCNNLNIPKYWLFTVLQA